MDLKDVRALLEDPEDWEINDDELVYDGDGDAATVKVTSEYGGFRVEWELGWYEQRGGADSGEGVPLLIEAFEAASRAMNAVLMKGSR